jgi:predicted Zn finger-like uncharacterized protein
MTSEPAQQVTCPHCSARYLLPTQLVGPGGARITCPSCRKSFSVPPGPAVSAEYPDHAAEATEDGPAWASRTPSAHERIDPVALPPSAATPVEARAPSKPASDAPAAGPASPDEIAHEVVEGLAERHGEAIVAANASGKLFAECGPHIMGADDDYRRRAGSAAGAGPFRSALRLKLGIELPEGSERPGR